MAFFYSLGEERTVSWGNFLLSSRDQGEKESSSFNVRGRERVEHEGDETSRFCHHYSFSPHSTLLTTFFLYLFSFFPLSFFFSLFSYLFFLFFFLFSSYLTETSDHNSEHNKKKVKISLKPRSCGFHEYNYLLFFSLPLLFFTLSLSLSLFLYSYEHKK